MGTRITWATAFAVLVCACEPSPRSLRWELTYDDPTLETVTAAYRFSIVVGGCAPGTDTFDAGPPDAGDGGDAGDTDAGMDAGMDAGPIPVPDAGPGGLVFEVEMRPDQEPPRRPPVLEPGLYGFIAEARSATCGSIAAGCTPVVLPARSEVVSVHLVRTPRAPPACSGMICDEGICDYGEAGGPDGGPLDGCVPMDELCNGMDDDCDGMTDEDFALSSDSRNCGSCGNVCPEAEQAFVLCTAGECAYECMPGWGDCDGVPGCEADLSRAVTCGACETSCGEPAPICGDIGGVRTCVDGCSTGQTRCDTSCVDASSDANHCGGCNMRCALPFATSACTGGTCTIATCQAGQGDCNGMPADGCEERLTANDLHCGACGTACAACQQCSATMCTNRFEGAGCAGGQCYGGVCCLGCWRYDGVARAWVCEPGNSASYCGTGASCTSCTSECRDCATGSCDPRPDTTACSSGLCFGGSCCAGCYNGSTCVAPPATTSTSCGARGESCFSCDCVSDSCSAGACVPSVPIREISAGSIHTCAITTTGRLYCWGDDFYGQLGDGGMAVRNAPRMVDTQTWLHVATGGTHTCGIVDTFSDDLYCWGDNRSSQVGVPGPGPFRSPMRVDSDWGTQLITAGNAHSCGHDITPTDLECWGADGDGQTGTMGTGADVPSPANVVGAGGTTTPSAGDQHTCYLSARDLYCFGDDSRGQLGNGAGITDENVPVRIAAATMWDRIAAGGTHTCAIAIDGTLWCWGSNDEGQLGTGTVGTDLHVPTRVPGGGWDSVYAGAQHTCAIRTSDRSLHCWGFNMFGQLGTGTAGASVSAPTPIGTAAWSSLSLGTNHSCGIQMNGSVHCWGQNRQGQLGVGDTADRGSPTRVCF